MNYRYSIRGCINWTLLASLLTISSLSIGTSVVAQDEVALEGLDLPLTIGTYQSPPGYREKIRELDQNRGVISSDDEWVSFFDAGVWSFFLKSPGEIDFLGELQKKIFTEFGGISDKGLSKGIKINLSNGETKYVMFHFYERYGNISQKELSCVAAHTLYYNL